RPPVATTTSHSHRSPRPSRSAPTNRDRPNATQARPRRTEAASARTRLPTARAEPFFKPGRTCPAAAAAGQPSAAGGLVGSLESGGEREELSVMGATPVSACPL